MNANLVPTLDNTPIPVRHAEISNTKLFSLFVFDIGTSVLVIILLCNLLVVACNTESTLALITQIIVGITFLFLMVTIVLCVSACAHRVGDLHIKGEYREVDL